MGIKTREQVKSDGVSHRGWVVWCPACDEGHSFDSRWTFDGRHEAPSFSPSMKVTSVGESGETICHSVLTDGVWNYCDDCTHAMKSQKVEAPDWPKPNYGGTRPSPGAPTE
jgi:hypothetical protein